MQRKIMVRALWMVLAGFTLVVLATWVNAPLSGDQRVSFAAARQADFTGNFPMNVDRAWEIKPLGNRVLIYGIYKATTLFSDFDDKISFERGTKITFGAVIVLATLGFTFSMRGFLRKLNLSPPLVFFAILLGFFSVSSFVPLDPEQMSILFVMAALPLALAKSRRLNILSGLPLALLFTLKGVTVLLAVPVLFMLFALGNEYRENLRWAVTGLVVWFVLVIATFALVFPQALHDFQDAAEIQGGIKIAPAFPAEYAWAFWRNFQHVPILLPGAVLTWLVLPVLAWRKEWITLGVIVAIWACASAVMLLQGPRGVAADHYVLLVVPAIAALLAFNWTTKDLEALLNKQKILFLFAWNLGLLALLGVLTFVDASSGVQPPYKILAFNIAAVGAGSFIALGWMSVRSNLFGNLRFLKIMPSGIALPIYTIVLVATVWTIYETPWGVNLTPDNIVSARQSAFEDLDEELQLSDQEELLFLGTGGNAYYLDGPSHCRHLYPLAIVRGPSSSPTAVEFSSAYLEQKDCISSYTGKYVVHNPKRYDLESLDWLADKLMGEYKRVATITLVPKESLVIWKRK